LRLHETLALHHPAAGTQAATTAQEALQHRGLRLLGLQEQRLPLSRPKKSSTQAGVPTLPTPTTLRAMSR
jgi:hypothetical protein